MAGASSLFDKKIPAHVDAVLKDFSSGRFAEDRRWTESGLFYQLKQWLDYDDTSMRYTQIKQDKKRPRPMPVSNYFAKTINANANALGADLVQTSAVATDDSPDSNRAAEYADLSKAAIDQETQMWILNPILAKHTVLWGAGCMHDEIDMTEQEDVPDMEEDQKLMVGCYDCGGTNTVDTHDAMQTLPDDGAVACPDCQSTQTTAYPLKQLITQAVQSVGKGKLKSTVIPIFFVFLPRDCQNPNLAKEHVRLEVLNLEVAKSRYPDFADELHKDEKPSTAILGYAELQTLIGRKQVDEETVTLKHWYVEWNRIPEQMQDVIIEQYGDEPDELVSMAKYGVLCVTDGVNVLSFKANPVVDPDTDVAYNPLTFFLWEVDPASCYSKGLGEDLKPLQKRLNRCDSLIERAMMANGAGKWLVPTTQQGKPPSGDPNDVYEYDVIGDGKIKPEFISPQPFTPQVWQLRNTILQDFETLGLQPPIMAGQVQGHEAFRTMAYAGAKAAESLNTQRFLWEQAHLLRYKKLNCMAKLAWDEPRKVRIAGHNGKLMYMTVQSEQLRGQYELDYVKGSSRPKTYEEKMTAFQTATQMMFINPADPTTRQFAFELFGLTGLVFSDELQYRKSERDLEMCKRGQLPRDTPYQKWDVFLKTFSDFTLTEDYEDLAPEIQLMIIGQTEHYNQMMIQVQQQQAMDAAMQAAQGQALMNAAGGGPPGKGKPGAPGGKGKQASPDEKTLSGVPGQNVSNGAVEHAAQDEGEHIAHSMQ